MVQAAGHADDSYVAGVLIGLFALIGARVLGDVLAPEDPLLGALLGAVAGGATAVPLVIAVRRLGGKRREGPHGAAPRERDEG